MSNNFLTPQQDQTIAGVYRLGALIADSAAGPVYETDFGEEARPAVIRICRAEKTELDQLVARWRVAMGFDFPHLLRVYAVGFSVFDDAPIAYVVMERADESLAGVLAERPLSQAETREMLIPAVAALKYLHKKGYAHSNLKASNILAVGDLLKLSSEDATPVEDGGSPEEDMWALGAVIVEALTQQRPKMGEDWGPGILTAGSEPVWDIVRHCVYPDPARRWTVDQVQARLDERAAPVSPPATASPVRVAERGVDNPSRTPKWVFLALAALVLIVVFVGFLRQRDSKSGAVVATRQSPSASSFSASSLQAPETIAPAAKDPSPALNPAPEGNVKTAASGARGKRQEGWSVIVAAYLSREPAEKRNREMTRKWPAFQWSLLQQQAGKGYYLVTIGQNLSEDAAEALRKRAVSSGLPRDTYIKRLP